MKKILTLFLCILTFVCMYTSCCFAKAGTEANNSKAGGSSTWAKEEARYQCTWPYSGTQYDITYTDENGESKSITVRMQDGETGYGGMNGYGSMGFGDKNPMKDEIVTITADNIEATLRKKGTPEAIAAANAIANGAGYDMYAQQYYYVEDKKTGKTEPYTLIDIEARNSEQLAEGAVFNYGLITYDINTPYKNAKGAWSDEEEGIVNKGHYFRSVKKTPTPTPTPTSTPQTPTPTASQTPTADGSPSPSPTPVPTPEQLVPSLTYEFREGGDKPCDDGISTTTKMSIDNDYFGVASGHAIPTSEDLDLVVKTNWIGNLEKVKESYIEITAASGVEYIQYYVDSYEIIETSFTYYYNEDGSYSHRDFDEDVYGDPYGPHESFTIPDNVYDEDGRVLKRYDVQEVVAVYGRKDVSNELIGQKIKYLYTGDAYVTGGASAGVVNAVLPNGSADTTLNNFPSVEIVKNGRYPLGCRGAYNDPSRVSKLNDAPIEDKACCYTHAISAYNSFHPSIKYFYSVKADESLTLSAYGTQKNGFDCDRKLVSQDFGKSANYLDSFSNNIGTIPSNRINRTTDGGYPTTYGYIEVGGVRETVTPINPVKVHTPIHATLTVTPTGTNQLTNSGLKGSSKIITLGEKFEAELRVTGDTKLYNDITQSDWPARMRKYIRYAEIMCGFCNETIDVTSEVRANGKATHACRVYVDYADDLKNITITGKVVAENIQSMSSRTYENSYTNTPDSYYAIEQNGGLFTVGKIYDLEVRATDDPSWKLKNLEKLSLLPTGENGDNSVTAYKNGIKLGYRAYYDLKTLGTGSEEVELTPKIYYVDKNGTLKGEIGNQYELWFKTSSTNYEKLQSSKDILTKMKVVTSKPDAFSIPFKEECAKLMKRLIERGVATIDYNKLITDMGGLMGLTLRKDNTVATKYTYWRRAGGTESLVTDYTKPEDKSRRWYGEIYVPASTRIIAKGNYTTNKTKVTNGTGIIKDGYIVVVFENIKSKTASGADYLKYDEVRDPEWNILTGVKSQLEKEKNGKTTIKLPNGKTFTAYAKNDAPIIIYDVSLRANNDYEQTGTH